MRTGQIPQLFFVFEFGLDGWEEALESIRQRRAENTLAPIWEVRRGLREDAQKGQKLADRAARRTAGGINYAGLKTTGFGCRAARRGW